jgi:hypothetical protein
MDMVNANIILIMDWAIRIIKRLRQVMIVSQDLDTMELMINLRLIRQEI